MTAPFWIYLFIVKAVLFFTFRKKIFALFKRKRVKKNTTYGNTLTVVREENQEFDDYNSDFPIGI